MTTFHYRNNDLSCDGVALAALAKKHGTPLYVMSRQHIDQQYAALSDAFAPISPLWCYAVKANFNLAIIKHLGRLGAGADVGSAGELFRARTAGIAPDKIVMSGVGKSLDDITTALRDGVRALKVESLGELTRIAEAAQRARTIAPIVLRMNPAVTAQTHAHIATGGRDDKFGIDAAQLSDALALIRTQPRLRLDGLAVHIGSQIPRPAPMVRTTRKMLALVRQLQAAGFPVRLLDLGGGFPIHYTATDPHESIDHFARALVPLLQSCTAQIIFEPGRFLVGNAGALVTRVLYRKTNSRGKNFVVVDAGSSELIRPVLYGAHHEILPLTKTRTTITADVVGPICESSDCFAHARTIAAVNEGDLLAIMSAGAYGSTMGSNYNGRLRPAEVLVEGSRARVIRTRETLEQLIQNETA